MQRILDSKMEGEPRMKKIRLLAVILAFSLMLMGVGYAAWTDQLTINTTVSTGEMDVDYAYMDSYDFDGSNVHVTMNAVPYQGDNDKIVVSMENLFPTEDPITAEWPYRGAAWYTYSIVNNSTIPVRLTSVDVLPEDPASDALLNKLYMITDDGLHTPNVPTYGYIYYQGTLVDYLTNMIAGKVLQPGETWTAFRHWVYLPLDSVSGQEFQDASCNYSVFMNWEQAVPVTTPPEAD